MREIKTIDFLVFTHLCKYFRNYNYSDLGESAYQGYNYCFDLYDKKMNHICVIHIDCRNGIISIKVKMTVGFDEVTVDITNQGDKLKGSSKKKLRLISMFIKNQ